MDNVRPKQAADFIQISEKHRVFRESTNDKVHSQVKIKYFLIKNFLIHDNQFTMSIFIVT